MHPEEVYFAIAFSLLAVCLVLPPTEFVAAGLTVQNLLSGFLGSEQMNFIHYHIRRTAATAVVHSFIPLGYYLGRFFVAKSVHQWIPWNQTLLWKLYFIVSMVIPLCVCCLVFHWSRNKWRAHPIAKILQHHAPEGSGWLAVASAINIEFRRVDKYTSGSPGRRLIVTDSWLIQTSTYHAHVVHQSELHLHLMGADEHQLSYESSSSSGVQYLSIRASSTNPMVKPFYIRLLASEYSDLRGKLQSPIVNARNVMIQQSLSDRFLAAFTEQVARNPVYHKPPDMDLEACIGCMQVPANVKLVKLCDEPGEGECVTCYCRPMWCMSCMGKWFSSRQDQSQPQAWMAGHSPCPTCRSKFCMLDVCAIV